MMIPSTERQTTPILEECKRLQEVQSLITELWSKEVHLYEQSSLSSYGVEDVCDVLHETRNHPNSLGTIDNETLFPYHTALYPLLDCYDSIRDAEYNIIQDARSVVRPSPAPLPFVFNGHRRSIYSPRLDRHGVHIEELATLHGNLPNSAWAIKQLMPQNRKDQFREMGNNNEDESDNNQTQQMMQRDEPNNEDDDNIQDEASRHNHNRFWNILLNPVSETSPPILPSSDASILEDEDNTGFIPSINDNADNARGFAFLKWWQHSIVKERRGVVPGVDAAKMQPSTQKYSPESLFTDNSPFPAFILLKVLKHCLSDLQREFRLARAVVLLMTDWRLCDNDNDEDNGVDEDGGIECLRRLLSVVSSEFVASCGGYCHEWYISNGGTSDDDEYEDLENSTRLDEPNHYCSDWWEFIGSLSTLISYGITYMTRRHASVICALVLQEINRASSALGLTDADGEKLSGKDYLKQNVFFLNNADNATRRNEGGVSQDGSGPQLNINLLLIILSAVRQHAVSDKMRLAKLLDMQRQGDDNVSVQISKSLDSFEACVDIMVDIGERILFRLPNNTHGMQLGAMVVRGLVESYAGSDNFSVQVDKPLTYLTRETDSNLRSLIDPLRYADAVANASENPLLDPSRSRGNNKTSSLSIEQLIGVQPPRDVQDVVKGLFMRDLVDIQVSGCGYGDYLSWCHLSISPEPLLFDYISNFPQILSSPDDVQPHNHWVADEDGTELDYPHLSARYDFSLLVFLRQWNSPWTPESHMSFSIPYRRAISTLALCAHRYGVPHDITALVNSYLPRSWWQDDRRCCWCRECQLTQMKFDYHAKILSRESNWVNKEKSTSSHLESDKRRKTPSSCPGCQVAMACSKDHLKYLHQEGHLRYCGRPPFRAPFSEEDNVLCREIFGKEEEDATNILEDEDDWEDDDDDGSWESVDSDEEVVEASKTDKIYKFFNHNSYKFQQREAPPFANFF